MRTTALQVFSLVMSCLLTVGVIGCAKSQSSQTANNQPAATSQSNTGSSSPVGQDAETATSSSSPKPTIDACTLLTSDEIRSVQGEPLKETKASGRVEKGLRVSQCFFSLPTFTNSVNLVLTQKGEGTGASEVKEFWERTFERNSQDERDREKDRDRKEENEKESAPPQKIQGVGDEAFWTGSRVGGALYVLKGNSIIRVSVGGPGNQETKINKSKALALIALKRL